MISKTPLIFLIALSTAVPTFATTMMEEQWKPQVPDQASSLAFQLTKTDRATLRTSFFNNLRNWSYFDAQKIIESGLVMEQQERNEMWFRWLGNPQLSQTISADEAIQAKNYIDNPDLSERALEAFARSRGKDLKREMADLLRSVSSPDSADRIDRIYQDSQR